MKIRYLGTAAAEGIPALFCNCEYCRSARREGGKNLRSRAQVLLDETLSIDFPPDAFYHGTKAGVNLSALRYLLITHSHCDHFYAHDFILRGYKYALDMASPTLDIYGNQEVCEVFLESTRRELRQDVAQNIRLHVIRSFETFMAGEYKITPLPARHSSNEPFVFLVEKGEKRYLHLCDTGRLPEQTYEYFKQISGVNLVTLDCTFLWHEDENPRRHMGLKDNEEVLRRLQTTGTVCPDTKKVITHFSHNAHPTAQSLTRAEEQFGVLAAYDGMEIEI